MEGLEKIVRTYYSMYPLIESTASEERLRSVLEANDILVPNITSEEGLIESLKSCDSIKIYLDRDVYADSLGYSKDYDRRDDETFYIDKNHKYHWYGEMGSEVGNVFKQWLNYNNMRHVQNSDLTWVDPTTFWLKERPSFDLIKEMIKLPYIKLARLIFNTRLPIEWLEQ